MIHIFAEELMPPAGFATWLACVAFVVFFCERAVSLYRQLQPRPPMDEQLKHAEQTIMKRLDDQDDKAETRVGKLHERMNVHADRIGYIEGHLNIRKGDRP